MRIKHLSIVLSLVLAFCGCSERNKPEQPLVVKSCAVMPSPRACASACAVGNKGYVFGGRDQAGNYLNDLWQYDADADNWTQISSFPGKARVHALMISDGEALYVGLGYEGLKAYQDSCYLRDLWRFTPSDGQWQTLAPCPYKNVVDGVPYIVGNRLYMLYAAGWSYTNDVVYYDLNTNEWHSVTDTGGRAEPCFSAAGAQCAGRCFFGTGLRKENLCHWYEVYLDEDKWIRRASVPGKGRELCAYTATDTHIYLFGGRFFAGEHTGGEVFNEYLRYDVAADRWEWCGAMPCGRAENMIAFTIQGKTYFGLGENENGQLVDRIYYIE